MVENCLSVKGLNRGSGWVRLTAGRVAWCSRIDNILGTVSRFYYGLYNDVRFYPLQQSMYSSAQTRPLRRVNFTNSDSVSTKEQRSRVDIGYGQEPRLIRSDSVGSHRLSQQEFLIIREIVNEAATTRTLLRLENYSSPCINISVTFFFFSVTPFQDLGLSQRKEKKKKGGGSWISPIMHGSVRMYR